MEKWDPKHRASAEEGEGAQTQDGAGEGPGPCEELSAYLKTWLLAENDAGHPRDGGLNLHTYRLGTFHYLKFLFLSLSLFLFSPRPLILSKHF